MIENQEGQRGKFIVVYGANNLGKTLQVELLEKYLQGKGIIAIRIKYPIYDLEPTGPAINAVLRQGKPIEEDELQQLYVKNRRDYESTLNSELERGVCVIAEDYKGTGIAWGMVRGMSLDRLEKINEGLLEEDVAIVFCGDRFSTGCELNHRNEQDDTIWQRAYDNHMLLADRYGWERVNANQTPEQVHEEVLVILKNKGLL